MAVLEFVNHASFILRSGQVSFLQDPWIHGSAFDSGWDLLTPSTFGFDEFASISHIWFSHEHPDHFSPPNLKSIPPDTRAKITVIYQETKDQRVAKFCRSLKFKEIIELKPGKWISISPDIQILCTPHDNGDSWIAIQTPDGLILNLNDCVIKSKRECKRILRQVGPIHLLATQFSYANWVGNPEDHRAMAEAATEKLSWMKTQIDALRPKYVLPFASFVFFSHEDNFFLNGGMTTVETAAEFIRKQTTALPIVFFPGDKWEVGADRPPDITPALQKYAHARNVALSRGYHHRSQTVPLETLISNGRQFVHKLRTKNGSLIRMLPPAFIHVDDHDAVLKISVGGVELMADSRSSCDIACKSDALNYCFLNEWGGRTLDINARFRVPIKGHYWKFKAWATLANFNSRGEGIGEICKTILVRLYNKARN